MREDKDLMRYLPSDIIFDDILTRLPVVAIMKCKCVCKSWLDFLTSRELADSYLSKSVPGLLILERDMRRPKAFKLIEFADDEDEHRMNIVINFDLPCNEALRSSVNGLLLLRKDGELLICNPITREYIKLPSLVTELAYGFGVSRMSSQYKVVRVFYDNISKVYQCEVYTVGTGSWKRVSSDVPLAYPEYEVGTCTGVFFNGNLHWLISEGVACFDVEKEVFSSTLLSSPARADYHVGRRNLSVLGDCLCIFDQYQEDKMVHHVYGCDIWLMKEYGNEKSWTKEFSIRLVMNPSLVYLYPVKVFKDGDDILIALGSNKLLLYSNKTQNIRQVDHRHHHHLSGQDSSYNIFCTRIFYAPSFPPLKTFTMENVNSF